MLPPDRSGPPLTLWFVLGLLLAVGFVPSAGAGAVGTSASEPPAELTDAAPDDRPRRLAPAGTAATNHATTTPSESPTTDSPTATPTDSPSESPTATPRSTNGSELVVTAVETTARVRPSEPFTVTATVRNDGNVTVTSPVEYVFDGSTVRSRETAVDPGEPQTVRFNVSGSSLGEPDSPVATGTYVHGVRTAAGESVARYLRVTPDIDLSVDGFDAPAELTANRSFVVLATVSNPENTTVTRRVTYRFAGTDVASKTLTVAGGEREQVAFAVSLGDVRSAGATVASGTTYDHAVVAAGGQRDTDAVRLVDEPAPAAAALVVERFDGPDDLRGAETYSVDTTVRNVDTVGFDGRLTYRLDGTVVAADAVTVPAGERTTVTFRVTGDDVDRVAESLATRSTEQGVWVADTALATNPVTVHGVTSGTATATPTPEPTLDRESTATPTPATTASTGTARQSEACRRGFFTRCGGTALDQTTLTVIGTVTSVLGIVYELFTGN